MSYAILNGMQKIRLSGSEKRMFARWGRLYAKSAQLEYSPPMFLRINGVITTAISLIGLVVLAAIVIVILLKTKARNKTLKFLKNLFPPVKKLTEKLLGHTIPYMGSPDTFRWMIIGQTIWKETGWGTIIFLAALTNVDTQLYEAAMVDGAGRLRRLWHITLPAIRSTIVLMLILRMGSMLDTGYDHLILMANPLNRSASQTLDVFVYQQGIQQGQFSYASAIGLMKSIVSVTLVLGSNKIAHLLGEQGLY